MVAGNAYLAEFARQAGAPHVEVLPTVIDLARYLVATRKRAAGEKHLSLDEGVTRYRSIYERLGG